MGMSATAFCCQRYKSLQVPPKSLFRTNPKPCVTATATGWHQTQRYAQLTSFLKQVSGCCQLQEQQKLKNSAASDIQWSVGQCHPFPNKIQKAEAATSGEGTAIIHRLTPHQLRDTIFITKNSGSKSSKGAGAPKDQVATVATVSPGCSPETMSQVDKSWHTSYPCLNISSQAAKAVLFWFGMVWINQRESQNRQRNPWHQRSFIHPSRDSWHPTAGRVPPPLLADQCFWKLWMVQNLSGYTVNKSIGWTKQKMCPTALVAKIESNIASKSVQTLCWNWV